MKEYLRVREKQRRAANIAGVVLTVGLHVGAVSICSFSGLKYIWPPPEEQSFVIDFTEEEEPEILLGTDNAQHQVYKPCPSDQQQKK